MEGVAVLLMAYGSPNTLEEVEPYYTDIRRGRKPSPELLYELQERYRRVGGRTPLLQITQAQAGALQAELGDDFQVYIGMKHWQPWIADAVTQICKDGHTRVIALALAPHYSRFSIDGYMRLVRTALEANGAELEVMPIESWNDHPLYVASLVERLNVTRLESGARNWDDLFVIFSAHSLPERIVQEGDPYPQELVETCDLVAAELGLKPDGWSFAYQSAGRTAEKWLGPDLLDALEETVAQGHRKMVSAPIGFVSDHLEILYDIDIEAMERAAQLGVELYRIPSANATSTFVSALADLVRNAAIVRLPAQEA